MTVFVTIVAWCLGLTKNGPRNVIMLFFIQVHSTLSNDRRESETMLQATILFTGTTEQEKLRVNWKTRLRVGSYV